MRSSGQKNMFSMTSVTNSKNNNNLIITGNQGSSIGQSNSRTLAQNLMKGSIQFSK